MLRKLLAAGLSLAVAAPAGAQVRLVAPVLPSAVSVPVVPTVLPPLAAPTPLMNIPSIAPAMPLIPAAPIAPAVAPAPSAARPALAAAAAQIHAAPGAPRAALDAAFDGGRAPLCAACAGEEIPASGAPAAAAPSSPASPDGRLPEGVTPRRYGLRLSLDPEAGTFRGRASVSLSLSAPQDRLVLHALDLEFSKVTVGGKALDASKIVVDPKAETVTLLLDEPAAKGRVQVELEYAGKMNELMRGLFKARGKNQGKDEAWSFTHLEPTHARRVLPCLDEPGFKAPFQLTLDVPEHLTPLSNMPAQSEVREGGRKIVTFAESPKMSSYLLAVFAARLVPNSRKVGKTLITIWAPPEQSAQTGFALDAAENALKTLNSYFGLPYQLPKLDLVVSPDFASGAMENWGAILFRDASLLIDPKLSSEAARRRVAEVVSHEIVHQWFGNLVTMKWWNDLWLNEAFATWLAAKVVDQWKPAWKVWDDFDQGKRGPLSIDSLPGTRPVRSDAATPAEIQAMFDPITYQKGGALLRMLEVYVGETAFRRGVRAYIRRFAYKNAEAADLARELERASGKPVKKMVDGWLKQAGVPVVAASASGRTLTLTQTRFTAMGAADATLWSVPVAVKYRLKGEKKARLARVLLDGPRAVVDLPGKGELLWAYPNADEAGYYRVALDEKLLAAALKHKGQLSAVERSGLLNNLWAGVRAGTLPVARFLDALSAYKGDPSRLILEDAAAYLKAVRQDLAADDASRAALGAFARDFFGPALGKLGWDKKKGESPEDALSRPTVLGALALLAPSPRLDQEITPRLDAYLKDPAALDATLAPVILTAAARRNDPRLFDAFRAILAAPKTPEQTDLMLRALAEFSAPALLDRYLAMILTDEIRPQNAWKPFMWLLSNPDTRERTWAFVQANWPALVAKMGPRGATRVIGAAGGLVSPDLRRQVEAFFRAPANDVEMARKTLDQSLSVIDLGVRFKDAQAGSFRQWAAVR